MIIDDKRKPELIAHLQVAARAHAGALSQHPQALDTIPETIRQLNSIHEIASLVAADQQEQE